VFKAAGRKAEPLRTLRFTKEFGTRERPFLFANRRTDIGILFSMIRKLQSGEYRLYSRKKDSKSGKRKNLGTFSSRAAAQKHERAVQYFKRG
jgi:hypothetical protein